MQFIPIKRFYTAMEIATELNLKERNIHRYIKELNIPFSRDGEYNAMMIKPEHFQRLKLFIEVSKVTRMTFKIMKKIPKKLLREILVYAR